MESQHFKAERNFRLVQSNLLASDENMEALCPVGD